MRETMWKCERCGEICSTQELKKDYIDGGYRGEPHYTCPCCGSEYVEEVYQCELCGEWFFSDEIFGSIGEMACKSCIEKHKKAEEVLDFADDDHVDVELNGLLAFAFEEDEINEILKREFLKLPKSQQRDIIDDYVSDTRSEFAEYLTRCEA